MLSICQHKNWNNFTTNVVVIYDACKNWLKVPVRYKINLPLDPQIRRPWSTSARLRSFTLNPTFIISEIPILFLMN